MIINNKDFLIIGSGISGITLARLLIDNGANKVKIIEKKSHIGGNCFDYQDKNGFFIHKYGPHIFHTANNDIVNFLTKYTSFKKFTHKVLVEYKNKLIPFPINFESIKDISNGNKNILNLLLSEFPNFKTVSIKQLINSSNLEIKSLGNDIYDYIYKNYTMKMWGISADEIDLNVLNRVKINLSNEWNYFPNDTFVGMPTNGWTSMMQNILNDSRIEVLLNTDYKDMYGINGFMDLLKLNVYSAIFFTGSIDDLFDYKYGQLPYRSLSFEFEYLPNINYFQPTSVVNYPAHLTLTRITEYKKLTLQEELNGTVIGKEYPGQYDINSKIFNVRYYPINNLENLSLFNKYYEEIKKINGLYILGRLGQYRYFDVDDAIDNAFELINKIIKE